MGVIFDTSDLDKGIAKLQKSAPSYVRKAVDAVATEILRLSSFEVPHDTGLLQDSGHTENLDDGSAIVGYNKVYAARLHEHPEYRFQKGRKGKYLEDPIKKNLQVFNKFFAEELGGLFK